MINLAKIMVNFVKVEMIMVMTLNCVLSSLYFGVLSLPTIIIILATLSIGFVLLSIPYKPKEALK